ncbi:MAG: DNA polymerase III subunit beta [Bacteroidetes bacterium]|nr:DNA polymerase III subunit beta [Bacteroidota bacterium]
MAITQENIQLAIETARDYGANKLVLFGSALYEPEKANDLDLAVDGIKGFKIFSYGNKLEELLNIHVDVVPLDLDSGFIQHIMKYGKVIYES